jgi:hypothetical protein
VITTSRKLWFAREVGTKTTRMGSLAIWHTTSIPPGMTTLWSHHQRPSSKRESTSKPRMLSLSRKIMNTMGRVVHVPSAHIRTPPLISLPPKAKGNQMTIPLTIITMKSHLSLRWSLFVGFGFFGWLGAL